MATETLQVKLKTRFDGEAVFVCQTLKSILHTSAAAVKPFVYKDLTMTLQALESRRFIRKTHLAPGEYRKNFHQIDREILTFITSEEADRVTPLMSKIYLRLVNAPGKYWEREGVLRIEAELRDEKMVKAWTVLCDLVGVASATARKAIQWMHEQGIIGYFSGKNGVGLRIFLNRAASSIGVRPASGGKKIFALPPASNGAARVSENETAFNDSFAVSENLDKDIDSRAPKDGAESRQFDKPSSERLTKFNPHARTTHSEKQGQFSTQLTMPDVATGVGLEEVVTRLRAELEPAIHAAARQAAAREHERTREWLERRGLPKAARVAQHEAYNLLRKYGLVNEKTRLARVQTDAGRNECISSTPQKLSMDDVVELAEACLAMLETKGQPIEQTLSGMGVEMGGFLLPEDVERVREKANGLLAGRSRREGN